MLSEKLPKSNIVRIDRDTVSGKNRREESFAIFQDPAPKIFIGTQLLAKGHDFKNVSLVIVLNLDFGLVLAVATTFAALSWILGGLIKLEELKKESKSYFFILLAITCIRSFAYEPYQIPSRSMVPGLQVGDFVLVNKHAYGLKFLGTHFLLTDISLPQRNDVAVFIPPHTLCDTTPIEARPDLSSLTTPESQLFLRKFNDLQESKCTPSGVKFVKRIIGIPGDLVEIKGYEIWINGKKLKQAILLSNSSEYLIEETIDEGVHIIRTLGLAEYAQHKW